MMRLFRPAIAALAASMAACASAEVFFDLKYHATLRDVKLIYPNARYEKLTPAWLTPDEAFYQISGSGLPAKVYVAFEDLRPGARKMLSEGQSDNDFLKSMATAADDDAITIKWVRVVYPDPVRLDVFSERYGKQTKCERDVTFRLECRWERFAIIGTMSQDGKSVEMVTTGFTKQERHDGFRSRGLTIPPWER